MEHSDLSRLVKSFPSRTTRAGRQPLTPPIEREEIPYTWGAHDLSPTGRCWLTHHQDGADRAARAAVGPVQCGCLAPLAGEMAHRPKHDGAHDECARCERDMDGYMCQFCRTYCVEFSVSRKPCSICQAWLLAERMDLTIEQRDFEEAWARGACSRGMGVERRTERCILAIILKDTANHHIKSVEKFGDLVDQFHNDAFAAYNAAMNGLTPELLLFVTRLECASLPNPGRSREERYSGRMTRKRHWRLLVIPLDTIGSRQPHVPQPDG